MIEINFLANKQSQKERQKLLDQRLFHISLYVLGGIFILALGLLGTRLFGSFQSKKVSKDIENSKKSILSNESMEISYLVFVNKVKVISEIYSNRSNKQEAMSYFTDQFQGVANITGMSYQEEKGGLILQLSNQHVFQLEKTLAILDSDSIYNHYKSVDKSTLSRTDDGSYELTVKLELENSIQ